MSKDIMDIPIPDMRYENGFMSKLQSNAAIAHKQKIAKQQGITMAEVQDPQDGQLPPITPSIVVYTILKDQVIMQFVQGFAMAIALMMVKPLLKSVFVAGRSAGQGFVNGIRTIGISLFPTTHNGNLY